MKLLKFNTEMIESILADRKTQTRRLIKPQPKVTEQELRSYGAWSEGYTLSQQVSAAWQAGFIDVNCPYGGNGDLILFYDQGGIPVGEINLRNTKVEQLQDISAEDAKAEGLAEISKDGKLFKFGIPDMDGLPGGCDIGWQWSEWEKNPVMAYKKLWASIYGEENWNNNPWVWVIEFRRFR